MKHALMAVGVLALGLGVAHAGDKGKPTTPAVENGSKVQIEYTLADDAGTVLDSNKGKPPLAFTQGQQQIIPGLEKALNGMHAGEQKKVTVAPEEGYGPINPKAEMEVPKDIVPPDAKVGTQLQGRSQNGRPIVARVKQIKEKTVLLDMNHPLAGKTLHFDVKVVGVEAPAPSK